jgi:uncharacterized protein (DUF1697 family)
VSRHIALLRGINLGKAKRIAMADLKALMEALGYKDVRTLLNSGNVVFTAPVRLKGDHATRIEKAIPSRLGVSCRVMVLSADELATALKDNPLGRVAADPSRFLICVFADPAHRDRLQPFTREEWGPEAFALGTRVAYLWCANGLLKSRLWSGVERALKDGVTARNLSTMNKLHGIAQEAGAK